jgi:7,8-dihydropterin-6-yl-methyl-4-(beta-D-ribofuranosyl)aminobenzene 5'-phosphate synthase
VIWGLFCFGEKMIKINVLLENYSVDKSLTAKHGLSVLIQYYDKRILLDLGPDDNFLKNANKQNISLNNVDYLFLSHNHNDHTGGINHFLQLNSSAKVYLMDNVQSEYYVKVLFFAFSVGLQLDKRHNSRIEQLANDLNINDKIYFLKNSVSKYKKPKFNKVLFKKEQGKMIRDNFEHEGILVLEDNDELIIFNACSHNGILNVIETVKSKIPNKNIRSYIGGLHLSNPITKAREDKGDLDFLAKKLMEMNIKIYTGHCTSRNVLHYLKKYLNDNIQEINTGMELNV